MEWAIQLVYFYLCTFSERKTGSTLHLSMEASGRTAAHALKHTNTNCSCATEMSVRFVLVNKRMNLYGKTTFREIESDFVDSSFVRSSCAVQLLFACRVCRRNNRNCHILLLLLLSSANWTEFVTLHVCQIDIRSTLFKQKKYIHANYIVKSIKWMCEWIQ